MKQLPLFLIVFLLVFFTGTGLVLFFRKPARPAEGRYPVSGVRSQTGKIRETVPPLRLPHGVTEQKGADNSWEYTGEIASNFVSARGRLSAWIQNQSWKPEKQITMDESLKPQVILTFSNREYELTLLLWKIDTGRTGFSYRRDKKSNFEGEIIQ